MTPDGVPSPTASARTLTLVLLAVVAIGGLALSGAVAADSAAGIDSGDRVWQGQSVDLTLNESGDSNLTLVEITDPDAGEGRPVEFTDGEATLETTDLDGEYALRAGNDSYRAIVDGEVQSAPASPENASFEVETQDLTIEDVTVKAGSSANLTVESNRDSYDLRLSSDLSTETLEEIDGANATDDDVIVPIDESNTTLELPLESVESGANDISASVVDTTAEERATVSVESWVSIETTELPAGPDATIEGESSFESGSEKIVLTFDPGDDERDEISTVGSNGTWSDTFDLSNIDPGDYPAKATALKSDATTTKTIEVKPLLTVETNEVHRGPNATIEGESMLEDDTRVNITVENDSGVVTSGETNVSDGKWCAGLDLARAEPGDYTVTVNATDSNASASSNLTVEPRITVATTELPTGPSATVSGSSIDENESVEIALLGENETIANASTNVENGTWSAEMNLTTVEPGDYVLSVAAGPTERTVPVTVVEQTARFDVGEVTRQAITFDSLELTHNGTVELRAGDANGPVVGSAEVAGEETNRTIPIDAGPTTETVVAVAMHPDETTYFDGNGTPVRQAIDLPDPLVDASDATTKSGETVTVTASVENATQVTLQGIPDGQGWKHKRTTVETDADPNTSWEGTSATVEWDEPQSTTINVTLEAPSRANDTFEFRWVANNGSYRTVAPANVTVNAPVVTVDDTTTYRGDVAKIDVELQDTTTGWVAIADGDLDILVNVTDVDGDGEVTLYVNTFAVRGDQIADEMRVWAEGGAVNEIINESTESWNRSTVQPLANSEYFLAGSPWIEARELVGPIKKGSLTVNDRNTKDLSLRSAGPTESLNDRDALLTALQEDTIPNRDRVSQSDSIVVELGVTGLDGAGELQQESSTLQTLRSMFADESVGVSMSLTSVAANETNSSVVNSDLTENASAAFVKPEQLYLVLDASELNLSADQEYEAEFTIDESSPLADETETVSDRVTVIEEPTSLTTTLAAAPNQTLAGQTTVPDGENLSVELESAADETILDETVTVDENGSWTLSADLPTDAFGASTLSTTGPAGQGYEQSVELGRPNATVSIANASHEHLTVENVTLEHGGQIVVHETNASGPIVGSNASLGTNETTANISLSNVSGDTTLVAVAHFDSADGYGPVYRTESGAPVNASASIEAPAEETPEPTETEADDSGGSIGGGGIDITEETPETESTPTEEPETTEQTDEPTETTEPTEEPTATTHETTTAKGGAGPDDSGGGIVLPALLIVIIGAIGVGLFVWLR